MIKKYIKHIIKSVIEPIIKEFRDEHFTAFSLMENGIELQSIEMIHKPSIGDVIVNTKERNKMFHYKFQVEKVELSVTGYTGILHGKKISKTNI